LAQRVQAQQAAQPVAEPAGPLRIRATGRLAATLVPAEWKSNASEWDATLEEVDVDRLGDRAAPGPGGWLGPPWSKQGWFQAHLLYAGHMHGTATAASANAAYRRLTIGAYRTETERIGLERALVTTLVA